MEQPPNPPTSPHQPAPAAGSEPTPDVPKPPIWQRPPTTPPITIPQPAVSKAPSSQPVAPATPPAQTPPSPVMPSAPASPTPTAADRSYLTLPAAGTPGSGVGAAGKPQWPTAPPTVGMGSRPTPPAAPKNRRRLGLAALALLLSAAIAGGAFFIGRSLAASDSAAESTPVAAEPTLVPEPTVVPTAPPPTTQPTPEPATPAPANDAPVPAPLPNEGADEPVAAVAQAVAPAVVLIQNDLGQGSGIIYDDSGLILTNAHVVGAFTDATITLASGVRVPGQVLGADPLTDVAVIKIEPDTEFGVATLAPESSVQVGQLAVAIGSPFGLEQTVTSGVVSAVGRVLQNPTENGLSIVAMIQTDAPINPGNSGGALADRQGRVIGMNTSIRTDGSGGNIGVGFAIPADTAKLIADRIIAGEPLEQGFLGINGGTPVIGDPGVVVSEVTPGSGAAAAGLQPDDLIVGFNGEEIKSMTDLAAAVRLEPPNAVVTVDFVRGGETLTVEVTLGVLSE